MKATGIVRKTDELGRIVIPMEIRKRMNIGIGDPIEVYVDEKGIVLRKFVNTCIICGCDETEKLKKYNGKPICEDCFEKMAIIKLTKMMSDIEIMEISSKGEDYNNKHLHISKEILHKALEVTEV